MTTALRRALTVLFFLAAVSGWALFANLYYNVAPVATYPDTTLESYVSNYLNDEISAESGRGTFDNVTGNSHYRLGGSALANINAIAAAKPATISDLAISGNIVTTTLWRAGNNALIEADFTLIARGQHTPTAYHFFLSDVDGSWEIETIWKIDISSTAPLVPNAPQASFAIPGGNAFPSLTPSPSPSPSPTGPAPKTPRPSLTPRHSASPAP
jgi:hypothetical protein